MFRDQMTDFTFMPIFRDQMEDKACNEGKGCTNDDAKPNHSPCCVMKRAAHSRSESCTEQEGVCQLFTVGRSGSPLSIMLACYAANAYISSGLLVGGMLAAMLAYDSSNQWFKAVLPMAVHTRHQHVLVPSTSACYQGRCQQ